MFCRLCWYNIIVEFISLRTSLKIKIDPVYFLFGADAFLTGKAVELITQTVGTTDITRLDETVSGSHIIALAQTVSMFGDKRIVIVRGVTDATLKELAKYAAKPNPNCVLILIGDSTATKAPASAKNMQVVDCNPMKGDVLCQLIAKQVRDCGKTVTGAAAGLLAQYCQNNYARINNEIIKLTNLCDAIDVKDVEEFVVRGEDFQIYELGNLVCKGDVSGAQKILCHLRNNGFDEYAIFGNMVSMFRRLYYSLCTKASNDSVAAVLKCSPYAINFARRDNRHLTPRIAEIYKQALEMEYKIKSGKIAPHAAVELTVFGMV